MTNVAAIIFAAVTTAQRSEGSPVAGGIVLFLIGVLYWGWHVWRWRQIGCSKCDGAGSFKSKSLVLGHPVKRPCPRCKRRGNTWRRRKWSPESEK